MSQLASIGEYKCGTGHPLVLLAGPCVIETPELTLQIARRIREITAELPVQFVFKASFDKANRTSITSYRGPGLEAGLDVLKQVRDEVGLTTRVKKEYGPTY